MERLVISYPTPLMWRGVFLLILLKAKTLPRSLTSGILFTYSKQRLSAILVLLATQVPKNELYLN